ncbi:TetR/AcrR family transcriptional regulator [Anaeromicropila herbilytica]|uniref:TetR family transcriptional regulator n=1 Tax=Anaeromicropila herbilytica TaxID=2785025 RepID=A0A7R7IBX2_9FIRM|nr:TetR/AcrR family transcriptional regulator [Anaeromicropila herbilytica]BCN30093.1 TetR family transcriptional regulator [Anaeromicropila herbilytica]
MKEQIFEVAIGQFNEKGLKFTMDDIARELSMSKKTLYTVFKNKDALFYEMVDYYFGQIKEAERQILENKELDIIQKIHRIMIVLPERYKSIDLRQLYLMKEKYPKIYQKVAKRIENDWEPTIELLKQAMVEKRIRPINITVLKVMIEATMEHFLQGSDLIDNNLAYEEALEEMMQIIMKGIVVIHN